MTFGSMFSSKIYNNFYNTNIKIKQCFSPFFQKFKLFFFFIIQNSFPPVYFTRYCLQMTAERVSRLVHEKNSLRCYRCEK